MKRVKGRKTYKKNIKWNKFGKVVKNKRNNDNISKKHKNNKFIQRGKEMVESHRKQKTVEDKYRQDAHSNATVFGIENMELAYNGEQVEEEEENAFDELVSVLGIQNDKEEQSDSEGSDDAEEDVESDAHEEDVESDAEEEDVNSEGEEQNDIESEDEEAEQAMQNDVNEHDEVESQDEDVDYEIEEDDLSDEESNDETISNVNIKNNQRTEVVDKTEENDDEKSATKCKALDIFALHLDYELPTAYVDQLLDSNIKQKSILRWPQLGNLQIEMAPDTEVKTEDPADNNTCSLQIKPPTKPLKAYTALDLERLCIKTALSKNSITQCTLSALQSEILAIINNYQDLFYPHRTLDNADEVRLTYCMHALNHMLKTRSRIVHHNAKLKSMSLKKSKKNVIIPDSYRDQGIVRPKVLIILPFRESAYRVVNQMVQLLFGIDASTLSDAEKKSINTSVINYERFSNEYSGQTLYLPKTNPKPVDYEQTFTGNTDDNFRIGISLTKKCMKLFTEFYVSDILIASPLGLRTIIGAPGSADRDYDFLNSIELLVIDQAELILAQNWENLLHVLEHLHLQPQSIRPDTDFQRVRPWCLSGLSHFYRQTLLFSSHELPEFRALFNNKCSNYRGQVRVVNPVISGDIRNIIIAIPQVFQRIKVNSLETQFDDRFNYFIKEVLPRFRASSFAHCMIYIPSYFDYVRLRNYFKSETINFVQICEYTKREKIARARDLFFHSGGHFMLYSERAHFYRRTRIKGIRHLIMYQPPAWPHFYSELCNLMQTANQNKHDGLEDSMSITVLYSKYDFLQLSGILGTEKAAKLLQSGKAAHAFSSE